MSISCYCGDWDGEGWYYFEPDDYSHLTTKRWRKCCSCNALIRPGDLSAKFTRETQPNEGSIEWRIYGDEMPLPPWFMCETCADLYFSLTELGYCVSLTKGESMRDLAELAAMYSRQPHLRPQA